MSGAEAILSSDDEMIFEGNKKDEDSEAQESNVWKRDPPSKFL